MKSHADLADLVREYKGVRESTLLPFVLTPPGQAICWRSPSRGKGLGYQGVLWPVRRDRQHQPQDRPSHRTLSRICIHRLQGERMLLKKLDLSFSFSSSLIFFIPGHRGSECSECSGGARDQGEEGHVQEGRGQAGQDLRRQASYRGSLC